MKQYKIISYPHPDMLERTVNEHLSQGWELAGGVAVVYKHEHAPNLVSHLEYAQALIKDDDKLQAGQ